MHIHHQTHPERVARRYGVSAEYVRRQWRFIQVAAEMAELDDVIDQLR